MVNLVSVINALILAVRQDHTTTGGSYDLSGVDRVQAGVFVRPPTLPFVAFGPPRVATDEGPPLGKFVRTVEIDFQGWVGSVAAKQTRMGDALRLLDDTMTAIETDHRDPSGTLFGIARTLEISCQVAGEQMEANPISPHFLGTVSLTYVVERGL